VESGDKRDVICDTIDQVHITTIRHSYAMLKGAVRCATSIFDRIYILYNKLSYMSYVFRGILLLKTLIFYIYRSRVTMQYNQ
jgi:hypothetical protein